MYMHIICANSINTNAKDHIHGFCDGECVRFGSIVLEALFSGFSGVWSLLHDGIRRH